MEIRVTLRGPLPLSLSTEVQYKEQILDVIKFCFWSWWSLGFNFFCFKIKVLHPESFGILRSFHALSERLGFVGSADQKVCFSLFLVYYLYICFSGSKLKCYLPIVTVVIVFFRLFRKDPSLPPHSHRWQGMGRSSLLSCKCSCSLLSVSSAASPVPNWISLNRFLLLEPPPQVTASPSTLSKYLPISPSISVHPVGSAALGIWWLRGLPGDRLNQVTGSQIHKST